ncbi:transcriptional regulator [Candidatus Dependentiae bacterium HGW-Dependentiae-1]|nr:MAG: transcriptional regulator [Candidatus Dependentiae bacterium HGW-Dependentiae-1]
MKMQKRKFRIGELAQHLNVERFVVRFWEKEFDIRSTRSAGGQRFYEEKDVEKFKLIKTLLYEKGFTIAGARKQLGQKRSAAGETKIIASQKTTIDDMTIKKLEKKKETLTEQIVLLQKKLLQLRESL